ncbi:MAG: phage tail protein [Erythrobacter sp.]|nr:phage tail protein [Erythrobacter sp.]
MRKSQLASTCAVIALLTSGLSVPANAQGSEPYLAQIGLVGFNFCPRGYAEANGAILSIASNTALFSLLGTTYGGDGRTTFALPDLRGRVAIGQGQGPGLANHSLGEQAGTETLTLLTTEMPSHTHAATVRVARINANTRAATNANFARASTVTYDDSNANGTTDAMNAGTVTNATAGGGQPHENRMPYIAMKWCVATQGIFPPRN